MCGAPDFKDCNELFRMLAAEIGPIHSVKELCPGVYYIDVWRTDVAFADEYFVVMDSSAIPQRAKSYGRECCGLQLYPLDDDTGGWRIVEYEVGKICDVQGLPLPQNLSLHNIAIYAAEYHPEYFGTHPVPLLTPRGYTLRHRSLENGIYWIETSRCEEVLAVCYPIWSTELSHLAEQTGEFDEYDKTHGVHETYSYIFFPKEVSCITIYELMKLRPSWAGKLIDKRALMNAIWRALPQYAVLANHQEQLGALVSSLLADFGLAGADEPQDLPERMISISQEAGEEYLLFD